MDFDIYGLTVILMLAIICFILDMWRREHNTLMNILLHAVAEIRKKIDRH